MLCRIQAYSGNSGSLFLKLINAVFYGLCSVFVNCLRKEDIFETCYSKKKAVLILLVYITHI